jgi:CRP-like cAMP-binding protein
LGRRGASARASEPTVLLSIEGSAFLGILSREPTLSKRIRERRDQREADNLEKRSEMFRLLTSLGAVDPQASIRFDSGEIIFREGDEADAAWLITAGEDSVYKEARPDEPLARLGVGQCFGERACVSNTPRSATVRALTPIPLRADFVAQKARAAAKRSKDGSQARRLLALAAIYDGETGTEAAKIGGLTLHSRQRSQLTTAELRGDGAD